MTQSRKRGRGDHWGVRYTWGGGVGRPWTVRALATASNTKTATCFHSKLTERHKPVERSTGVLLVRG